MKTQHLSSQLLRQLGDEALHMESIYLTLKVEKALMGEHFKRNHLLYEAETLWNDIRSEYYSFLDFLQKKSDAAA